MTNEHKPNYQSMVNGVAIAIHNNFQYIGQSDTTPDDYNNFIRFVAQQIVEQMPQTVEKVIRSTNRDVDDYHETDYWYIGTVDCNKSDQRPTLVHYQQIKPLWPVQQRCMDDDFKCDCGNHLCSSGFYPVDINGQFCEPTIDGPWHKQWYKCDQCGQIINDTNPHNDGHGD